jgi:hypothetical protein
MFPCSCSNTDRVNICTVLYESKYTLFMYQGQPCLCGWNWKIGRNSSVLFHYRQDLLPPNSPSDIQLASCYRLTLPDCEGGCNRREHSLPQAGGQEEVHCNCLYSMNHWAAGSSGKVPLCCCSVRMNLWIHLYANMYIGMYVCKDWPPLWSSGQSSWLQIRRPRFDSRHYPQNKLWVWNGIHSASRVELRSYFIEK